MSSPQKMPTLFLTHGGGPSFYLENFSIGPEIGKGGKMEKWYRNELPKLMPQPKAILVVSAHWEEDVHTVTAYEKTNLLFDYYGFPDETYKLKYPCPGSPALAQRVVDLLGAAGIECQMETKRGLDHGVFIPLSLVYPEANIPIVSLSMQSGRNPLHHLKVGKALAALRDEGVLIVGSGSATHNLRLVFQSQPSSKPPTWATDFDNWLRDTLTNPDAEAREKEILNYHKAPGGLTAHPKGADEHFIPLFAALGAGSQDKGTRIYEGLLNNGLGLACFMFG